MKKKSYDISKLTPEQKIRLSTSAQGSEFLGIRGDTLFEPTIFPVKMKSEKRITGDNGQCISLMRDTPRAPGTGYGAQTGAGTIAIGVGYSSHDPRSTTIPSPKGFDLEPVSYVRDHRTTAAEIYISQKTDVDGNLKIPDGNIGQMQAKSSISLKADSIRLVSREGIKFVTGGTEDELNSGGGKIYSVPRINIIAGHDDSDLQPVARAGQMETVIKDIYEQINNLNSVVDTFLTSQIEFNSAVMTHQHGTLPTQMVGALATGNPFAYNGGKTEPSWELISSGMKTLSTEYVAKIDGIMQKLQVAITSFNSADVAGPKNSASPSFYTT